MSIHMDLGLIYEHISGQRAIIESPTIYMDWGPNLQTHISGQTDGAQAYINGQTAITENPTIC